jgi:hypothetical protein
MSQATSKIKVNQRKMGYEELQTYLKAKKQGNGKHKSPKDYNRKNNKWKEVI